MPFSGLELVVVLLIVLIIFGAGKLPQVFGALGKGVREFRDASEGKDDSAATATTATTPSSTTTAATPPVAPPSQPAATQYVPPANEPTQKTG